MVIRDLLDNDELGLTLLTGGKTALSRRVRGVHSIELDDPIRWLAKGWILLTTGLRLHGRPEAQRQLVAQLDGFGLAGLAYAEHVVFGGERPRALLDEAAKRDFPVISVPQETNFRDIIRLASGQLASDDILLLRRQLSSYTYLLQSLESHDPTAVILRRLAEMVDATVVLVDRAKKVEAATGPIPEEIIQATGRSDSGQQSDLDLDRWRAFIVPVTSENSVRAWLIVASQNGSVRDPSLTRMAKAAASILSSVYRTRHFQRVDQIMIGESVLDQLIDSNSTAFPQELVARAKSLGLDLFRPTRTIVFRHAHLIPGSDGESPDGSLAPNGREMYVDSPRTHIIDVFMDKGIPNLSTVRAGSIVVLAQASLEELRSALSSLQDVSVDWRAGIGRSVSSVSEVARSYEDALIAVAESRSESGSSVAFEDLGLEALLVASAGDSPIRKRITELLSTLHDSETLYETLVAYFESGCRVKATSEALWLHPNSVRYRLSQIEKKLGLNFEDPSAIAQLYIALGAEKSLGRQVES